MLHNPALHMNPPERDKQFAEYRKEHYGANPEWQAGTWVYLPWRHTLLHILEDDGYQEVRTGRNRNLITVGEQRISLHSRSV